MKLSNFLRILFEIVLIAGFIVVGFYTVLSIYGYKYNISDSDIEKISVIDIGGDEKNISLILDNKEEATKLPLTIRNISPGTHRIFIKKPDYFPFNAFVNIRPDLATKIDSVVLMPENIEFKPVQANNTAIQNLFLENLNSNISSDGSKVLYLEKNELVVEDMKIGSKNLLSRFSAQIENLKFFSDDYNILFTRNGRLFFCDQLMQNCYSLRDFKKGDEFTSSDGKIFFKEGFSKKIFILDLNPAD